MKIPGMKNVLAAEIAEVLPNITSEVAVNFIERAHQKPIKLPELQKEREPLGKNQILGHRRIKTSLH